MNITIDNLNSSLELLNRTAGAPKEAYTEGKQNKGHYFLAKNFTKFTLLVTSGSDNEEPYYVFGVNWYSKKELLIRMNSLRRGIEIGLKIKDQQ